MPKIQHQDLQTSAQTIARERGLDTDANRKVYLPVIRAYRVGPELVAWTDGKICGTGIYRQTGCYIERIRRNGILANPDGDAVAQMGDEIALVGYPDAQRVSIRASVTERSVRPRPAGHAYRHRRLWLNHNAVGRRLRAAEADRPRLFPNRVIRSQIEMPIDDNVVLNKGDVCRSAAMPDELKPLPIVSALSRFHSQVTDLLAFCAFFIIGLMIGMITFQFSNFSFGIGNAAGLLFAGDHAGLPASEPSHLRLHPSGNAEHGKEFGLMVFMAGVGLSAGSGIGNGLGAVGWQMLVSDLSSAWYR